MEGLEDRLAPATLLTLANGVGLSEGSLVEDSHGNLFGTSVESGIYGFGTVFEVANGSNTVTTLASFDGANGNEPTGDLILDSDGNLFGTTYFGGTYSGSSGQAVGTVFELPNGSSTITDLVTFNNSEQGALLGYLPASGLFKDSQGNLFGTTTAGGEYGYGTVFEIPNGTTTLTVRASFFSSHDRVLGATPFAAPIEDRYGSLYGTTTQGGAYDKGTVYEVTAGGTLITLADLNGLGNDTSSSYSRLVQDGHGNLFGTTKGGGTYGYGSVYEVTNDGTVSNASHTLTTLASFDGATNGSNPSTIGGGMFMDGHGNLFGTTSTGGANGHGTVFEIAKGSNAITTLIDCDINYGAGPYNGLIADTNGNLFGICTDYGGGSVFEVQTGISPFGDVTVQAPDVTSSNAAQQNPYTFSVAFHDEKLVNYQSVLAATIQVQPPSGPALTAQLLGTVESNPDASNNSSDITAQYQITPPGGSWSTAPAGNYSVVLTGSPVTDLAGFAATLGTAGTFNVSAVQATPTVVVNPVSVTYDGNAHGTTGEAYGVDGIDLGPVAITYDTPDGNAPVHSGIYTATGTFAGNQDYTSATGTASIDIEKANATIAVSPYSVTYDGKSHTATGTATGVLGEALGGLDLSGTAHSTARVYADTWTFTDTTGDYNNDSGTVSDKIDKAPLTVSVKSYLMLAGKKPPAISGTITGLVIGDTVIVAYRTTATAKSKAGQYATTAAVTGAGLSNYTLSVTNGTMYVVNQGADPAASGPKMLSFWDSPKNAKLISVAELIALDGLNLVDNSGNAFDPTSAAQLQKWLSGASKMSSRGYLLSRQFAVAELNVLAGFAKGSDLIYAGGLLPFGAQNNVPGLTSGGFLSLQNLFTSANALLLQDPLGGPTDTNDGYFNSLTTALSAINANKWFVTQELSWNLVDLYQLGILW